MYTARHRRDPLGRIRRRMDHPASWVELIAACMGMGIIAALMTLVALAR